MKTFQLHSFLFKIFTDDDDGQFISLPKNLIMRALKTAIND